MSESPIRVQISNNFTIDGIAIRISLRYSHEEIKVGKVNEYGSLQFESYDVGSLADPGVTFSFNDDIGRALLDELLRYYQGSTDTHTVRTDLLHERGRVDKLIGAIIGIASQPQILRIYPQVELGRQRNADAQD